MHQSHLSHASRSWWAVPTLRCCPGPSTRGWAPPTHNPLGDARRPARPGAFLPRRVGTAPHPYIVLICHFLSIYAPIPFLPHFPVVVGDAHPTVLFAPHFSAVVGNASPTVHVRRGSHCLPCSLPVP